MKKYFLYCFILIFLIGCSVENKVCLEKSEEEVFSDFLTDASASKKEYKKYNYILKGTIFYIGMPKDTYHKKNVNYIAFDTNEIESIEKPRRCIMIYFDRWIDEEYKVGDEVEISCYFSKYSKGEYIEMIIFHELSEKPTDANN